MGKRKRASITNTVYQTQATTPPKGEGVSRNGGTYTFKWKICDVDYGGGQWFRYRTRASISSAWVAWSGWTSTGVTNTSIDLSLGVKYQVAFEVKGLRKAFSKKSGNTTVKYEPSVSAVGSLTWTATIPGFDSFSYTRTAANAGTFSWNVKTSDTDNAIFTRVDYETVTTRNNANPPTSGWIRSTKPATGSVSYTETLNGSNLVRWVRVRTVGPAGESGWSYQRHAYGSPYAPELLSASGTISGTAIRITAKWKAPADLLHPVETITIQYAIAIPTTTNLSAPASGWTDAVDFVANGTDQVVVNISDAISADECMWIRVRSNHDEDFHAYSAAKLAYTGTLQTPDINAVPDPTTGNVAISIDKNTRCDVACTAIFYRSQKRPNYDEIVAVLAPDETSTTVYIREINTNLPGYVTRTCFGAYSFVGSYTGTSVKALMKSGTSIDSDIVAVAPAWLELSEGSKTDSVRIKWPWTWEDAISAELSWADHDDAWESTDEPSNYDIDNKQIESWVIAKLDVGKRWYFRVRLIGSDSGEEVIGPWSAIYSYNLSTVPDKPVLILNKSVINADSIVTARWGYTSEDDTEQQYADVCLATINDGEITYGDVISHTGENRTVDIIRTWETGETYYLCLRVTSTSGQQSEWSDPAPLYVADPIEMTVEHSLEEDENGDLILTEMPLTVTATGAGTAGQTVVSIVRAENYHIYRPDDSDFDGFEGEDIASVVQGGEGLVTLTVDDLVGALDDGAKYILKCTVIDDYGQTEYEEYPFIVAWTHQAGKPKAEVTVDEWQRIAVITPIAPDNWQEGDVCDIYRISSDKPELVVKGAEFGTKYVDPYPAFGFQCGHRIVTRTANGDYITAGNELAWFLADSDVGDVLEESAMIIDVNGAQIELPYNIELQNAWTKDFKRTTYLGGSVQGDWNPAVTRDLSANTTILRGRDLDLQIALRGLAGYAGSAHIRTPDGSSLTCDIQVRENWTYQSKRMSYSLAVKVVDPQQPDGMTYEQWASMNPAEE